MHLATDPINPVTSQFVDHGFSTADALNKGASIWSPATIIIRSSYVTHLSTENHDVGQIAEVEDYVGAKSDYCEENIKLILKFGWKIPNFNLST